MEGVYYDSAGNYIGAERTQLEVDRASLDRIIHFYRPQRQKSKAVEELLELSEVLIKDINKHELNKDALYEELADVEIMMEQLLLIYSIDLERLQQEVNRKISRTLDRMTLVPDCGWR